MSTAGRLKSTIAWLALSMLTFAACFWAFWGAIEAFHEGWCVPTLSGRLLQTAVYMTPATVLVSLAAICICAPRTGSALCVSIAIALTCWVIVSRANFGPFILATLIGTPLIIGTAFWFFQIKAKRIALLVSVGLPLMVAFACGCEPAYRVANRFDDGIRSERFIQGNDVELIWAPAGPGWTRKGNVTWSEAVQQASRLSKDGSKLEDNPVNEWRLPTRSEVVASLTRQNMNCGGRWDETAATATYETTPDKESPLWDPLAPLIYLWTSESASKDRAWIIVYHGGVHTKPKGMGASSLGFRAVKQPQH